VKLATGEHGDLVLVALTGEELCELLAFETNCAQLVPCKSQVLLEDIMRRDGIPGEEMRRYLEAPELSRDDVWDLQILKRRRSDNHRAVRVLEDLRKAEARHGVRLLDHLPALHRGLRTGCRTGVC
jgi:hypothetical protein